MFCVHVESKHNKLKGKDGSRPTAHGMVKELSQAREDHLNSFLSTSNPQPHCTAWGAQDLSQNRDDSSSDDTWSSDSERESCCSCYRMPRWERKQSSNQEDEDEMYKTLVGSDELSREHELQES